MYLHRQCLRLNPLRLRADPLWLPSSKAPTFVGVALARLQLSSFRVGLSWAGARPFASVEGSTTILQSYHWASVSTSYPILPLGKAGEKELCLPQCSVAHLPCGSGRKRVNS